MADWEKSVEQANRYAKSTPLNWSVIGTGMERGFERRRRRARRQFVGAAVAGTAAAIVGALLISPGHEPRTVEPAVPYTDRTAQLFMNECAAQLPSTRANAADVLISPNKRYVAAVVRDDTQALFCTGVDAASSVVSSEELVLSERSGPKKLAVEWTVERLGPSTYVAAVEAKSPLVRGAWVGGSDFTIPQRLKRVGNAGALHMILVQRPVPLQAKEYLVFGLSDKQGCECGATLRVDESSFASPSP